MNQRSQQAVALVITLIFLSVITLVTVAFLRLTSIERDAARETTGMAHAELMADAARERALGEIAARLSRDRDFYGFGLLMSTNLDIDQLYWTNLVYDPRPPVFVKTNLGVNPDPLDYRFFLDLNRNSAYESWTNSDEALGDPEWIGVQSRLSRPHGPRNQFLGRYAYLVQPVGVTLDLNFIHNQAKRTNDLALPGYLRNQGVGSWEINLAAFLVDLHTNAWNPPTNPYVYLPDPSPLPASASRGVAFQDALDLLRFRYAGNMANVASAHDYFLGWGDFAFTNDAVDGYANGPIRSLGAPLTPPDEWGPIVENDDPRRMAWPGSDNPQRFFTIHELVAPRNPSLNYSGFTNRLSLVSTNVRSPYDSTTFYRMLTQLGTDSAPELSDKFNLNYIDRGTFADGTPIVPAHFLSWTNQLVYNGVVTNGSELFFHLVTERLLGDEFGTNFLSGQRFSWRLGIPISVNGRSGFAVTNGADVFLRSYYDARIHRALQLAANLHDATLGSRSGEDYPYYPTVFKPVFETRGPDIFITGYTELTNAAPALTGRWRDLDWDRPIAPGDFVYGIPLIIGARKGFPNFNEFAMANDVFVTRKLQVIKSARTCALLETNQMLTMSITNSTGFEVWNSYATRFPRELAIVFTNELSSVLTGSNHLGQLVLVTNLIFGAARVVPAGWAGFREDDARRLSFRVPLNTNFTILPNSVYRITGGPRFDPVGLNQFERNPAGYTNQWDLRVTNRFRYFLIDHGRIVDAVSFANVGARFDISAELDKPLVTDSTREVDNVWNIARVDNVTAGVKNQILVSLGEAPSDPADWTSFGSGSLDSSIIEGKSAGIQRFRQLLKFAPDPHCQTNSAATTNFAMHAPFAPIRRIRQQVLWQANDPLVHYRLHDLADSTNSAVVQTVLPRSQWLTFSNELGEVNTRYRPWGRSFSQQIDSPDPAELDLAVRDPGMVSSDAWDFPTNKLAGLGWLGRVHRGTPWQTLYLKSTPAESASWLRHIGANFVEEIDLYNPNRLVTHPTNDWRLVDFFTVGITPSMTRGLLSVNQTNLAAWSAVLSGVPVSRVDGASVGEAQLQDVIIEPAALDNALRIIVAGLNLTRSNTPPSRQFRRVGDILATPELTVASPFLLPPHTVLDRSLANQYVLRDLDYERIPHQILSLLKVGEHRFVVYAWGQALRPAQGAVLASGPSAGLCTNYQITAELATRSVVRFETDPAPRAVIESFSVLPPE